MTFPTKGIELIVPTIAETEITGFRCGFNFNRRGHDYAVQCHRAGLSIERDGVKVRSWDDLPANVQKLIVKARDNYAPQNSELPG